MTAWLDEATASSIKAGIYITLAVLVFLLASLRSIRYTLLASSPLIIGMIWMLGIYPLLGMKLNIMNIIMIPLVIGMGIDFGIHLAHRFQVENDIDAVYRYTGKAVFLSAMTTMIGFGSLGLIGKFPSIASMGTILFLGITCCLLAALLVLPALLHFNGNGKGKGEVK
jgi:predicted RND superfamily exporter protein